jgi:hypothetical protein
MGSVLFSEKNIYAAAATATALSQRLPNSLLPPESTDPALTEVLHWSTSVEPHGADPPTIAIDEDAAFPELARRPLDHIWFVQKREYLVTLANWTLFSGSDRRFATVLRIEIRHPHRVDWPTSGWHAAVAELKTASEQWRRSRLQQSKYLNRITDANRAGTWRRQPPNGATSFGWLQCDGSAKTGSESRRPPRQTAPHPPARFSNEVAKVVLSRIKTLHQRPKRH